MVKSNKISPKSPSVPKVSSSLPGGLAAIDYTTPQTEIIKQTASFIPWLLKFGFIIGTLWFVWYKYNNRFQQLKYNSSYPKSNITDTDAETRASTIYNSISLFDNSFEAVKDAIAGLNYNGFVKLYNAFGHHTGTIFGGELDLIGWCKNQFSDDQILKLKFLLGGQFF